jgi:hypothetical protein
VQRAPDSGGSPGTYADLQTGIAAAVETYVDSTPAELTTYWYRVGARNGVGITYATGVSVRTPGAVAPSSEDAVTEQGTPALGLTGAVAPSSEDAVTEQGAPTLGPEPAVARVIEKYGTQDQVDSGSTLAVTQEQVSTTASAATWTNDDDAPWAQFTLEMTFASAPGSSALRGIGLFGRRLNIVGTSDESAPSTNQFHPVFLGVFVVDSVGTLQRAHLRCRLPNVKASQEWQFFIANYQTTVSAGWALYVTPYTLGPG